MICTTILSAVALLSTTSWAIPPEDFGFPSAPNDTALTVTFPNGGNATTVVEAELFGIDVPADVPRIGVNGAGFRSLAEFNGTYVVLMVDPDAPTPNNPSSRFILHWLQPNMAVTNNTEAGSPGIRVLTNASAPAVPYLRPGPPPTSDAHRYILYAFQQPQGFSIPSDFSGYNAQNRSSFNLTNFISEAQLDVPAAAMFYYCTNKTGVPADFIAAPGGSYPGGNGAAITAGPGPSPTPTSTSSGTGSSSSGSAPASSSNPAMTSTGPSSTPSAAGNGAASSFHSIPIVSTFVVSLGWVLMLQL